MDYSPRVPAYVGLNIVQVSLTYIEYSNYVSITCSLVVFSLLLFNQAAAQLLSATMIIRAHTVTIASASSILRRPWFVVLVIAAAVERLCGVASGVAMERDWVVLVFHPKLYGLIKYWQPSKLFFLI